MSKQHCRSNRQLCCRLLRQCCRFGQQCLSNVWLSRKDEISTQNSFDFVAIFGNKVERCFDIVAGVDRALLIALVHANCNSLPLFSWKLHEMHLCWRPPAINHKVAIYCSSFISCRSCISISDVIFARHPLLLYTCVTPPMCMDVINEWWFRTAECTYKNSRHALLPNPSCVLAESDDLLAIKGHRPLTYISHKSIRRLDCVALISETTFLRARSSSACTM